MKKEVFIVKSEPYLLQLTPQEAKYLHDTLQHLQEIAMRAQVGPIFLDTALLAKLRAYVKLATPREE